MLATHRHPDRIPIGWTSASNLFSVVFALLAALALIVLLMLFLQMVERERQTHPPPGPMHAAVSAWGAPS